MEHRLAQQWIETARLLQIVLDAIHGAIDVDQASQLAEFIEHREFGLARDVMMETIADKGIALDVRASEALDAAILMTTV